MLLTPKDLYEQVKVDNLYFQATGGGICFGGGEPTMYADFIAEFRQICGHKWKITIETSLHCSHNIIRQLSKVVDHWIVDIKAMNPRAYEHYTGKTSDILQHLTSLQTNVPSEKVTIKVPQIPGFTDERDLDFNIKDIERRFNFTDIVKTRYRTNNREHSQYYEHGNW